jgi:hypothetical protein
MSNTTNTNQTPAKERDYLRKVAIEALIGRKWTLNTWDTGKRHARGTTMIGYELISPEGVVLFTGEDFSPSPMNADDADETLQGIMCFLTLKLGDTDREYFDSYTPEQMAFAESYECEAMQSWGMEAEEGYPASQFENLDEWEG